MRHLRDQDVCKPFTQPSLSQTLSLQKFLRNKREQNINKSCVASHPIDGSTMTGSVAQKRTFHSTRYLAFAKSLKKKKKKKSCQKALHTYHTNMKMQIMTKIMELTWLSRSFAFLISLLVEHLLHHKKSCTIDIRKSISASLARTSLTPRRSHSQSSGNMHLTLDVGFDDLKRMYP